MCYVYILQSLKNNQYYIGSSHDPIQRLAKHNAGSVTSTRYKRPWVLLYTQEYADTKTARKQEYNLKKQKSRVILERIIREQNQKLGE